MISKRVLLLEPRYRNKYPPLGLMKLSTYHKRRGDEVLFAKGGLNTRSVQISLLDRPWDRVYVTTLFSFEWKRTAETIDLAIQAAGMQPERVFVGGIAASLMYDSFASEPRWAGVRFIRGLLDGPPAVSLQLRPQEFEFGADDLSGQPIEELAPDYSILHDIDYTYPVHDAYFGYASRGCVRKCSFCGVPKLEGGQREMPPLATLIRGVDAQDGPKKDLVLMDNNVTASARFGDIIAEIRDLGFQRGAKIRRGNGQTVSRRVDFNQGVDARILVKSPMYLREMATICISPLRIAFDHMGLRKIYERAVRMAAENGIISLSNYMLYNFMDNPADLFERMRLNIELNERLNIRIWSFPMKYLPVTDKNRFHVGCNWNRYFLRSFQIMLQATHGVVSGNPSFFERAYGKNLAEFLWLLSLPHSFIFHRSYYEFGDGKAVLAKYSSLRRSLSVTEERDLMDILSSPSVDGGISLGRFGVLSKEPSISSKVRSVLQFHALETQRRPAGEVSDGGLKADQFELGFPMPKPEQFVEDAGLFEVGFDSSH